MEYLVIASIVQSLMSDDWDWEQVCNVNVGDVSAIYQYILELVQTLQLDLALFERKQDSFEKLLERTIFKWDIFRQQNMVIKI